MENLTQGQILLLFVAVLQQVLNWHKARPDYKTAYNWDPTSVSNKLFVLRHELAIQRKRDVLLLGSRYLLTAEKQQESDVLVMAPDVNAII